MPATTNSPSPSARIPGERLRARFPALAATAIFLASAVYYGLCLYPGLGGELNAGDSAKFQILGHTPIMVHGPGYPFVLLLGTFVRALGLPVPPWWAMTFMLAAVPAAIANAMAFLIVHRLTASAPLALAGVLLLGTADLMAIQATEAEVYPLALAFLLATLYLLLLFSHTGRAGYFIAACAVYAISFGNHLMMVMLVPLFAWMAVLHHRTVLRPRVVIPVLGFILLGASQYFVYLVYVTHDPRTSYSEYMPLPPTFRELAEYVAGTHFQALYGAGFNSSKNVFRLLETLNSAHPWVSAPLIAAGLLLFLWCWNLESAAWRGASLLIGAAVCFVPFMLGYGAFDIRAFHLPVLAPLLLAAVVGIGLALRHRRVLLTGSASVLVVFGLVRAAQTAAELRDRESEYADLKPAIEEIFEHAPLEKPFMSLAYGLRMASLYYELRGELPKPAIYRLIARTPEQVWGQEIVGGVVMPSDGYRLVRRIMQRRPDMNCVIEYIEHRFEDRWRAYSYLCKAGKSKRPRRPVSSV